MSVPKVYFIILTYNSASCIKRCLASVFRSKYPDFEVVVVDNNSKDGTAEIVRKNFSKAHLIINDENLGFAAGCNVGIRFCLEKMADYVMLLNPDAQVQEDSLDELMAAALDFKQGGIISPLIMEKNTDSVWFAGAKIEWLKTRTVHLRNLLSPDPFAVDLATGCAMLIKKEVFEKAGLFDEKFFLYYEDADLSLRAREEGLGIIVAPKAKVYHWELSRENEERKTYWLAISGLVFFNKHAKGVARVWIKSFFALRRIKNLLDLLRGKPLSKIVNKAYRDYGKSFR